MKLTGRTVPFTIRAVWIVIVTTVSLITLAPGHGLAMNGVSSEIRVLGIDGVINPLSARYFKREVDHAIRDRVQAVVLELNTPGGLETSMREIVQTMLASSVPIVVFVTPQGARAASAGMFLTMAGHVAAMAPGTNIGAAHPVSIGGAQEQKPDKVMNEKVVNDAAALARSIARDRDRNASWAEDAVRKSVSITAGEAVSNKVVDFVAVDLNDVMSKLDGKRIPLRSGAVILKTSQARLVQKGMHLPERILQTITDPNIAYLLISIGFIGIIAELYSPGLFFPGIIGVISLIIGFSAIGSLPIGWAGLVLLMIGIGLLVLEAQDPGIGVFGVAGIIAFVLGSLMLYTPISTPSPALPKVSVSPWLIGGLASGFAAFVLVVFRSAVTAKRNPSSVGGAALVGSVGVAVTDLAPKGTVKIDSEQWSAILSWDARVDKIYSGEKVEVVGNDGVVLRVKKYSAADHAHDKKLKLAR